MRAHRPRRARQGDPDRAVARGLHLVHVQPGKLRRAPRDSRVRLPTHPRRARQVLCWRRRRAGSGGLAAAPCALVRSSSEPAVAVPPSRAVLLLALALCSSGLSGCKKPYRVGEYVMVDWEENRPFAAYITDKVSATHYRVHFDGYDCDQDVSLDRIKGRVQGAVPPPSPGKLPCAHAVPAPSGSAPVVTSAAFKANDHVRVTWRG